MTLCHDNDVLYFAVPFSTAIATDITRAYLEGALLPVLVDTILASARGIWSPDACDPKRGGAPRLGFHFFRVDAPVCRVHHAAWMRIKGDENLPSPAAEMRWRRRRRRESTSQTHFSSAASLNNMLQQRNASSENASARQYMKLHGSLSDHKKSATLASGEWLSLQVHVK